MARKRKGKGNGKHSIAYYASFSHLAMSFSKSNRGSSGSVMTVGRDLRN